MIVIFALPEANYIGWFQSLAKYLALSALILMFK